MRLGVHPSCNLLNLFRFREDSRAGTRAVRAVGGQSVLKLHPGAQSRRSAVRVSPGFVVGRGTRV
jgi:hypothetical protein